MRGLKARLSASKAEAAMIGRIMIEQFRGPTANVAGIMGQKNRGAIRTSHSRVLERLVRIGQAMHHIDFETKPENVSDRKTPPCG